MEMIKHEPKWLYRLESSTPENGLWYNQNGDYVWGCKDCSGTAKDLPMDYDERYHVDGKNWFSSCSCKEDLLHWYSLKDAKYLLTHGFVFTKYLATDYIEYPTQETVFLKETALSREEIDIVELFSDDIYGRKTISFGKVDYNRSGRKNCLVTVEIELKETKNGPVFTASGNIWNPRKTDIYCGGQCLDEISHYMIGNKLFMKVYRLWKDHHLNDMHAGDEAQEAELDKYVCESGGSYQYEWSCKHLEEVGLLVHNGYRYGSGWLYRAIPKEYLMEIRRLLL